MKAITLLECGASDVLRLEDVARPAVSDDDVLIRVAVASLELSADLRVLIEIVGDEAHVEHVLPIDEMLTDGALVRVERVGAGHGRPGAARACGCLTHAREYFGLRR